MFVINLIRKLYKGLSGAQSPLQIALGFGLGVMFGLVPFKSGIGILLLAIILACKVSFPFAAVGWAIAGALRVSVLGGTLASLGYSLLEVAPLAGFWTFFLNLPIVGLLDLEYYGIMGGAALGLLAAIALFYPIRFLVIRYREVVVGRLSKSKTFKFLGKLWIVKLLRWILVGATA